MEIVTVHSTKAPDAVTGEHPPTIPMAWKTHVFNANLQKELLLKFEQNSKIKL